MRRDTTLICSSSPWQGNVDKVVMVIKDKDDVALERFIFAVQNMVEVEPFNKDTGYSAFRSKNIFI